MSRWGSTGVFDSSQLTAVKQTRNVYANALAQRTAVDKAGKPFMRIQSASAGEGGPVNGFSIASDTGALNLTQAEFDAIVAQETPGPSGPSGPPTLTFIFNGSGGTPLNISTIPAGYTSLAYFLCGGGGSGGSSTGNGAGGGGSGGYLAATVSVSAGQAISIVFGTGGQGGPSTGAAGNPTVLTVNSVQFTAGGGGFGGTVDVNGDGGDGGAGGSPSGSGQAGYNNPGVNEGGNGGSGGGGGGGGGAGGQVGSGGGGANNATTGDDGSLDDSRIGGNGGNGYYRLILT